MIIRNSQKTEVTTIMRKNNVLKITALALLSAFALTACDDDIIAKPTGYDDNSPVVSLNTTVYNNDFTDIYDSIREGSLPSDVLDELLYQYSVSVFGNYNKVTASAFKNQFGDITLKQAVNSYKNGDKSDADKFIKAHKAYWTKNKDGKRVDDTNHEVKDPDNAAPSMSEYARLEKKWSTIEERIAKKLYASISNGSYSERNVFEEERFVRSLATSIEHKVRQIDSESKLFKGVLTPAVEDYDIFDEEKGKTKDINGNMDHILHRENYQSHADLKDDQESKDQDATYVEDEIIPDIYRQLLVEQYILDESYDTLGRTSARHISVLAINKNASYAKGAVNLMNTFINDVIFNNDRTYDIDLDIFKIVSNAWIGTFMDDVNYNAASTDGKPTPWSLMNAAVGEDYLKDSPKSGDEYLSASKKYFQGTDFGEMMEEMEKLSNNPHLSENESTYTGNNAYSIETGKKIEKSKLELKDYTSTGWYIKSTGAGSLPDAIKNQLFDINVANAFNNKDSEKANCVEYKFENNEWKTNEWTAEQNQENSENKLGSLINVVGKIKGQYFLRNTTRVKGTPVQNDILFENDGTYYIVLVEDAIRSTNLKKIDLTEVEQAGLTPEQIAAKFSQLETYIDEIVQLVADNDTYKTLSKKHWLEEMDLKYHDQKVYDYFKSNFPELFEDD